MDDHIGAALALGTLRGTPGALGAVTFAEIAAKRAAKRCAGSVPTIVSGALRHVDIGMSQDGPARNWHSARLCAVNVTGGAAEHEAPAERTANEGPVQRTLTRSEPWTALSDGPGGVTDRCARWVFGRLRWGRRVSSLGSPETDTALEFGLMFPPG